MDLDAAPAGRVLRSPGLRAEARRAGSAAAQLAPRGIRVNVVTPGVIETRALQGLVSALGGTTRKPEDVRDAMVRRIPLKRVGNPLEVAHAILFLASDEASYVTGAEILVDGGLRTA